MRIQTAVPFLPNLRSLQSIRYYTTNRDLIQTNGGIDTKEEIYSKLETHAKEKSQVEEERGDELTHVTKEGKVTMVDVTPKPPTERTATAKATVKIGPRITQLIKENKMKKGDVLTIAQIAGISAAKKTWDLIPLCHNIPLNNVKVSVTLDEENEAVVVESSAKCSGKTGVEMEALVAASVAALTIYDMCKAVSHDIVISEVFLTGKSGGSRGDFTRETVSVREYEKTPVGGEGVCLGAF